MTQTEAVRFIKDWLWWKGGDAGMHNILEMAAMLMDYDKKGLDQFDKRTVRYVEKEK